MKVDIKYVRTHVQTHLYMYMSIPTSSLVNGHHPLICILSCCRLVVCNKCAGLFHRIWGRMAISFANRSFVLCASSGRWNTLAWNAVVVVRPSLFGRGVHKHLPCCSIGTKIKRTVLTIMCSLMAPDAAVGRSSGHGRPKRPEGRDDDG